MPPRKEPKESVVYPASKRPAPAFKPQRPSKVPRIATTDSESAQPKKKPATTARRPSKAQSIEDDDEESETAAEQSDLEKELPIDPLSAKPKSKKPSKAPPTTKRKAAVRELSPMSISSQDGPSPPHVDAPPLLSQPDDTLGIPQPLIVRLLHEHFADKQTKIDKHAVQVLQKYLEVFVRETIARTALRKKESAGNGEVAEGDASWLEQEDLEKVAPGMMLDF